MNKSIFGLVVILILSIGVAEVKSQDDQNYGQSDTTTYYFRNVDKEPEPEIGKQEFYKAWAESVKYPAEARRNGTTGKVSIFFIVDKEGNIINSGVKQGIGSGCDEVTLESFRKVNCKWKPGMKNGRAVKVRMVMTFNFSLG